NKRWFDYTGTTLSDMEGWGWKSVHHPDHVDRVVARVQHSWDTGELWEDTFPLRGADGEYRWFLSRALPIRNDAGVIQYWFGTNTDVTEMRNAEKRIELLLMEVNHRSKNMLAVVQSLARRTLTKGGEELERLEQRIHSMAASQDLLVHRAWSSIPVREMVQAQLAFVEDSVRDQVRFDGPAINLSPAAAEAISMALHEMATNALKYGALSDMAGKVTIAWGVDPEENFWIEWRESGGPAVKQPEKKGFGSRVIEDVPRGKLDGNVRIEFAEHGFSWRLDCPSHRCVGDTLEDSPTVRSED
ncbi:MAG: PAS domain-containing protein, partial [Novosphingobium sp.]|nr:PAS domain-containing protein [Novosphingobium sp.]